MYRGCVGLRAVATVTSERCRAGLPPPALDNATSGFIASVVLSDTPGCSDGRQMWTIRASPGQQITLQLYDFYAQLPTPAPPTGRQLNHPPITRRTLSHLVVTSYQTFILRLRVSSSCLCAFLSVFARAKVVEILKQFQ